MSDTDPVIPDLLRDEGLKLKPYTDTRGKLSIGVGRNLTDVGISREEAGDLLAHDVARVRVGLAATLPWWDRLDPGRQRVLVNMAFNLGVTGLLAFHDLLDAVARRDWETAASEMLESAWAGQVGARATRLAAQMRTGG